MNDTEWDQAWEDRHQGPEWPTVMQFTSYGFARPLWGPMTGPPVKFTAVLVMFGWRYHASVSVTFFLN